MTGSDRKWATLNASAIGTSENTKVFAVSSTVVRLGWQGLQLGFSRDHSLLMVVCSSPRIRPCDYAAMQ
jgi:hypothetical protein